jgi:uncharacterized damage-inducible protein DinB
MSVKTELQQELEATRLAYCELLAHIPDEAFPLPSGNPAWNIGEVLYHMSIAPRMIGADVRMITSQNWIYRWLAVLVPERLFNWLNARMTRFGARHMSREFLAQSYNRANEAACQALASITEGDFSRGLDYPDWDPMLTGEVTLERLFRYLKLHFEHHAAEIRDQLALE